MIVDKARYATSLLAGCLAKFCFSDCYISWMAPFLMFYILLRCSEMLSKKQSFVMGYVFGIGYFASSLYWVHRSFECVGMGGVGVIANFVLILYLSLYTGAALWLTSFVSRHFTPIKSLFFACGWVLFEYVRGFMFTGFPWNLIGYSTYSLPFFKQVAGLIGIYGVSLTYMLVICLIFTKQTWKYSCFIGVVAMSYGAYIELVQIDKSKENDIDIQIVQPCISQENKLSRASFMDNLNSHLILSNLEEMPKKRRIVIWPEAAINTFLSEEIVTRIASLIKHEHIYVFFGTDRRDSDGKIYNSSVLIDKSGSVISIYDKKHLLPFGEFIPDFLLNMGLRKVTAGMVNFSEGKYSRVIKAESIPEFGVIICYEAAFPGEMVEGTRPEWIVNITNDAWFECSDEIYQHLVTTSFRAIEEGIPIFRSANTGVSCVIDRKGKVIEAIAEDVSGVINTKLSLGSRKTMYSKFGNYTFLLIIMCLMFSCLVYRNTLGHKNNLRSSKFI